jgi:Sigma-70 region 2
LRVTPFHLASKLRGSHKGGFTQGRVLTMRAGSVRDTSGDARLMSEFGQRRAGAVEELFSRFGAGIYGIGMRCFRDTDLASELVERTFVRMWRRASRYASSSVSLDAWVAYQTLGVALEMSRPHAAHQEGAASHRSLERRMTDDAYAAMA